MNKKTFISLEEYNQVEQTSLAAKKFLSDERFKFIRDYINNDVQDATKNSATATLTNKTLTSPVINTSVSGTAILNDNTFATASTTTVPTSESVKNYVGNQTSITSSATPTPTGDRKHNELYITALAVAANFQAPSGTPTNGNTLTIRVKDDGTARALTWNAIFNPRYATLPTTTTVNKYLHIEFVYNSTASTWDCVKSLLEDESNSTNIVGVRVLRTSAQSISHNTETAIQYTSETFDTHNFHDNTNNNTRMTVPSGKGGLYLLTANANFASNSTGRRALLFRKNGSTTFAQSEWGNSASNAPHMNLSSMIDMVAGDYVEVFVFQSSGGNLNISTYLNASFIRLGTIPS
jgi:hypothetical protein